MRRLVVALGALLISGCGLVGETERAPPVARLDAAVQSCSLPPAEDLVDLDRATEAQLALAVDCIEGQLEDAFRQIRGDTADEITLGELRTLRDRGVIDLSLDSEAKWKALEGLLSFMHPTGRAALSRERLRSLVAWARANEALYLRLLRSKALPEWSVAVQAADALEAFVSHVSERGAISLEHALAGIDAFGPRDSIAELRDRVSGAWKLKGLALEGSASADSDGDLSGASVRRLVSMAARAFRLGELTYRWGIREFVPAEVPAGLPAEWERVAAVIRQYFGSARFPVIDADQASWALRRLAPREGLADLAPDLVRVSQRLTEATDKGSGIEPAGFASLLQAAGDVARDVVAGARAYPSDCTRSWECSVPLRNAIAHPLLGRIALKGPVRQYLGPDSSGRRLPPVKRLDVSFGWDDALGRLVLRGAMRRLFLAFDRDADGRIPLEGSRSSETREALDLAYTFLRFASAGQSAEDRPGAPREALAPILVKPGALYRTLGLVGDRWMPDGNADGALDAEEFFSVVRVYDDIQNVGRDSVSGVGSLQQYVPDPAVPPWLTPGGAYYSRRSFVLNIHAGYEWFMPWMHRAMVEMGDTARGSLIHGLVGVPDEPVDVYATQPWGTPGTPLRVTLRQHARPNAGQAPAAIFSLIDRLMIRCDRTEDEALSWTELDCAMPLVLSAGLQTVSSELVDLDPGVHDGSKLALQLLASGGLPTAVAKLIAINGAVREVRLPRGSVDRLKSELSTDWAGVALLIGAPTGPDSTLEQRALWALEARRRYGTCDQGGDGMLRGMEFECLTDLVLTQAEELLVRVAGDRLPEATVRALVQAVRESELARLAVLISAHDPAAIDAVFERDPNLQSSPAKILTVLEQNIRRSEGLCQLPDC